MERTGGRWGLISMCCGGGLGTGTLIERLWGLLGRGGARSQRRARSRGARAGRRGRIPRRGDSRKG
ncbi:MAG: hypothetical protein R2695_08265 [Acidimicrobiales bacterium]